MKECFKQLGLRIFSVLTLTSFLSNAQLNIIDNFGANPGNLRCYTHIPSNIQSFENVPLIVVLHGCSQNAMEISEETGWNDLADKFGFIILYPEQKAANNVTHCFNWFSKGDIRFNGESSSIKNMIDFSLKNYQINKDLVFCYGLSAGGAMCSSLLAQYPETFNTGAVLAGGPYGLATNAYQAMQVMKDGKTDLTSSAALAKLVTELHATPKIYPKLIVMHGNNDHVVDPKNATNLVNQWIGLHPEINCELTFEKENLQHGKTMIYCTNYTDDSSEKVIIKEYIINNLGHLLPVNPGKNKYEGGKTGTYAIDIDFFSTYYIAKDFGILTEE